MANALFPRLAGRLRWWDRAGGRGAVIYVLLNVGAAAVTWGFVIPKMKSWNAWRDAELAKLEERLGRPPTMDEELDHFREVLEGRE